MTCKICGHKTTTLFRKMFDQRHGYPKLFSIEKCKFCNFTQTKPQILPKELTQIYSNYYPRRDINIQKIVQSSKKIPNRLQIFIRGLKTNCHYQTQKGQRVLDIGCGNCQSLLEIKKLGGNPWGIDPDKNSQKVAKKLRLKFHLGTIHDCKFPKKYFDLITLSQVLEHEIYPIKLLEECKKFLKPNGKIILSVPNTDSLTLTILRRKWLHWHIPYHLNHFNRKSLRILFKKTNYKIMKINSYTPNSWLILQTQTLIKKNKIGIRDPIWDSKNSINKFDKNLLMIFLKKLYQIVEYFLSIYRLIDLFGLGESLVIEVKPLSE